MNVSARHPLDRLTWSALMTTQAHLGQGGPLARRYHPDISPFAALADETPAAYEALYQLLQDDEQVAMFTLDPITPIDALHVEHLGTLYQMVAIRNASRLAEPARPGSPVSLLSPVSLIPLGAADAADMLDLVARTQPGPFARRTCEMGRYLGIRDEGRLIAMAGERMCIDGYVEISAVCVDDAYRGKGLAARLIDTLRCGIEQRGSTPFLHVFTHNTTAIGLYQRLGFVPRQTFHVSRVKRA
jgi:predicted GNAT family acetyltransferase